MRQIRDERGATAVMLAIVLVAVIGLTGLAIDGGRGFADRRQVQNAVDAAALAGANALTGYRANPVVDASTVSNAVTAKVTGNLANGAITCRFIDFTGSPVSSSDCSSFTGRTIPPGADGVSVTSADSRPTTFTRVLGFTSLTAHGGAAATIEPLVGTKSPFIICGNAAVGGYDLLTNGQIDPVKVVQYEAPNPPVAIQGSKVPNCAGGTQGSFDGKNQDNQIVTLGQWINGYQGNGYEQDIHDTVAGAVLCPTGGPFNNCDILLPVADQGVGNGNQGIFAHIVAWTLWHITGNGLGNPKYQANYVAARSPVTGGEGGQGRCDPVVQLCVVHLIK